MKDWLTPKMFVLCCAITMLCLWRLLGAVAAQQPLEESLIKDLRWRNIGNANQRGRISAIDALDKDWTHVVAGTASGGVFKSVNGGTTWTPIFDNYGSASIGDVRIFQPDPNIIWVGAGEECGRNSAAWGDGVYKSTDGGKTFKNVGLRNTYNIGAIVTHPADPNIVYVAALGNIWGPVGDRGFFKTTDGGQTWTKLTAGLPNDYGRTGALYAVMDATDPNTIYVSFWGRDRTPYRLTSGGPHGGIFKTTDGGKTFRKLTKGLPDGPSGKIGLAIARSNPKVLMAHYEHSFHPRQNEPDYKDMTKLGSGLYRSEDAGESWQYMNRYYSRPFYYNHVAISPLDDKLTYHYNQNFTISTDGGRTLQSPRGGGIGGGGGGGGIGGGGGGGGVGGGGGLGGGHCWHAIWLDPHNKSRFYTGSDGGVTLTHDGGQNWVTFKNINATQYYMVGVDLRDPYYVCGGLQDAGTSCGPSLARSRGIYLNEWYSVQGGDGYHVQPDPLDWRTVYSGQDPRGVATEISRFNVETRQRRDVHPHKGKNILNYDEYITPEIEAAQLAKGWGELPPHDRPFNYRTGGSGAFRWNWSTPIVLSPHGNPRTLYAGANHLFKTTDRGETWRLISPDLTKNDPEKTRNITGGLTSDVEPGGGAEHYGTIVTIGESPVKPGVIWVGTDDGNVQVTQNGGKTWTNVARNIRGLPSPELYVSRVRPSKFDAAVCFVTIDGHESAIFQPFVFKTTDYGATWTNITNNLPDGGPVYVIEQDNRNPDLLFVGTEFAIYYSINGGQRWTKFNRNLPTVAVHDILVHPRDPDLIIATHGRGIWIMDDISALQQLTPETLVAEAHLFQNKMATRWLSIEPMSGAGDYGFAGENPTKNAVINYYLGSAAQGEVAIEISDAKGQPTRRYTFQAKPGAGKLEWDLRFPTGIAAEAAARGGQPVQGPGGQSAPVSNVAGGGQTGQGQGRPGGGFGGGGFGGFGGPPAVEPGTYRVKMTVNGKSYAGAITVRPDPMPGSAN
jgi:photosystem II stability/assembly factor-like uncharacterized protein